MLELAGIDHDAASPGLEDGDLRPGAVSAEQWVAALAYLKAAAGRLHVPRHDDRVLVLGADTACVQDGRLIGTPLTDAEAREMLRAFSGRTHRVITGVSILDTKTGRRHLFVDDATVSVGPLSDRQIDEYVASGDWRGKAGAYNLSERQGAGWPIACTGDPTTVMGLPMRALARRLRRITGRIQTPISEPMEPAGA